MLEPHSEYPHLRPCWEVDGVMMCWFPEGQKTVIARIRRGKWTPIPREWQGKTTMKPTIRKRPSKMSKKRRRRIANGERYKGEKSAPTE